MGDIISALPAPPVRPTAAPAPSAPKAERSHTKQALPDFRRTIVLASGTGPGPSLSAATDLGVPIVFGAIVAVFLLTQYILGRRDPRLADAPERGDDDSVPFE